MYRVLFEDLHHKHTNNHIDYRNYLSNLKAERQKTPQILAKWMVNDEERE